MKRRASLLLLLLLACPPRASTAQEGPELFVRIERAFAGQEQPWKVVRTYPSNCLDPLTLDVVFESPEGLQSALLVMAWRGEQDAREFFKLAAAAEDKSRAEHGEQAVKEAVPNLGDENHIWTSRGARPTPTVHFRQGNVVVSLYAPTAELTKKFARLVLEQIEADKRPAAKAGGS